MTGERATVVTAPPGESNLRTRPPWWARRRWWLIAGGVILGLVAVYAALLAWNWPFTRAAVTEALQNRFARTVQIRSFRTTYFPPGCVVEGVSFEHRKRKDLPPLITVDSLILRGTYRGFLHIHKRLDDVQVRGLHVTIPPPKAGGGPSPVMPLNNSTGGGTIVIGEITTENALLEFMPRRPGEKPFKLYIHRLAVDEVGSDGVVPYHATIHNTEPPGEIRSDGEIGSWNEDDPAETTVKGTYTYDRANLAAFKAISGSLSSEGKFSGTIGHIDTEGETDVPDFHISGNKHSVRLKAYFHAVVDGTNGDTYLQKVDAHFGRTTITGSGSVAGKPDSNGKTIQLSVAVSGGRIEDLLTLLMDRDPPWMAGALKLNAKIQVPPGPSEFLEKLNLTGRFAIEKEHFANPNVQRPLDALTDSARGEDKKQQTDDPATALSEARGQASAKLGVATLSKVEITAQGSRLQLQGTYGLVDKRIDVLGTLYTDGKLSDTTSGFKALVLKALGPFLKKNSVTVVPFKITGVYPDANFSLDLANKHREPTLPPSPR